MVPGYEQATARVTPDGGLELRVGVHSHGQGLETTLAQVAHEILGIDVGKDQGRARRYRDDALFDRHLGLALHGDGGGAVSTACKEIARRAIRSARNCCRRMPTRDGARRRGGRSPAASVSLGEIARTWYLRPQDLPGDVDPGGLEATVGYKPRATPARSAMPPTLRWWRSIPRSATSRFSTMSIVEDGGKLVNPMIVDGQIYGGIAQGIGTALYEEMPFDASGPAARVDLRRLPAAGPDRSAGAAPRSHGDARAVHGVRRQGHRRGRRDRAAGGDRQRRQRCAAAAGRGTAAFADHAAPHPRGASRRRPAAARMKAVRFDYERPQRPRRRARARWPQATASVKIMAGGQSLGPMLNLRLVAARLLVDITGDCRAQAGRGDAR